MQSLIKKKERRFLFLKALYEAVDGVSESRFLSMWELGESLGMDRKETSNIMDYLSGEGLAKYMALGGGIAITHYGVKHVEEAISKPDQETQYFPAYNVINIQNMINSSVQQASNHAQQTVIYGTSDMKGVLNFISELKSKLPEIEMSNEDRAEVESDISTIESQINSPRPKHAFITECLKSIRSVLEGTAGGIIAAGLLSMFPQLPQ